MGYHPQKLDEYLKASRKAKLRQDRLVCIALGTGFVICALTGTTRKGAITLSIGFVLGSLNSRVFWEKTS